MEKQTYTFSGAKVDYYFDGSMKQLKEIVDPKAAVIITDENVFKAHHAAFKNWNTIALKAGEQYKVQATVDAIVEQLIALGVDRKFTLVGVGGGVITDITGYIASIYMRGIRCGFVPTTLLAMVDASIGGKNGIDVGIYKNMVGIIRQPSFLLYDFKLLSSLPEAEWQNGFAEIIKHAAIKDGALFRELQQHNIGYYQKNKKALAALVKRNALIKTKVVLKDEFEKGDRRLLNFGHTLGHAIENQYELSHGQAVAIGMTYAAELSERILNYKGKNELIELIKAYQLPTYAKFSMKKAIAVLEKDKKKEKAVMNYILLQKNGKGVVYPIPMSDLTNLLLQL